MAVDTKSISVGDIVYWEEDNNYSRDDITVASGQTLSLGAVIGKVTASGEYAEHNPGASDGTENAAGIILADCDASSAAADSVALVREAIIGADNLVWRTGATDQQKADALADLKALGIIARTQA